MKEEKEGSKQSILVFCGSSLGSDPALANMARSLAAEIVKHNLRLIYGGGNVGLMGVIASEVLKLGGEVIGIIPEFLMYKEVGNLETTELHIVKSMHERKALMCDKTDYILAIPGGFGTLDELFEMLTWLQLGLHRKPIGILNFEGFFDPLLQQLEVMINKGLLKASNKELICLESFIDKIIPSLMAKEFAESDTWFLDRNLS